MVQNYIQTRSCSQIRSHSQKYFYKLNKKYQNNNIAKILNQEEINKLINKNKFSNKDMENAKQKSSRSQFMTATVTFWKC